MMIEHEYLMPAGRVALFVVECPAQRRVNAQDLEEISRYLQTAHLFQTIATAQIQRRPGADRKIVEGSDTTEIAVVQVRDLVAVARLNLDEPFRLAGRGSLQDGRVEQRKERGIDAYSNAETGNQHDENARSPKQIARTVLQVAHCVIDEPQCFPRSGSPPAWS